MTQTPQHDHLIDERHGVDQQLRVYSILLMQDFHCIGPRPEAWKAVQRFFVTSCLTKALANHPKKYNRPTKKNVAYSGNCTSFGVHGGDGFDQQWGVWLGVLHEHQQKLESCFHHQPELRQRMASLKLTLDQKNSKNKECVHTICKSVALFDVVIWRRRGDLCTIYMPYIYY